MYATKVSLRAYAYAVVLIRKLSTRYGIKIETAHTATYARVVLQAALISTTYAAAMYLCNSYTPNAWEGITRYYRYDNRITLAQTSINVH